MSLYLARILIVTRIAMIVILLNGIVMMLSLYLIYIWVPPAAILGETSRIVYLHVPLAWVSCLAFAVAGIASVLFLKKSKITYIVYARSSAHIGLFFSILTVITGSLWAKVMWGSYWNWDPRETSITLLLLLYIAYFSLQQIVSGNPKAPMLESVYLIIAFVASPFLIFVAPRLYPTLHPEPVINAQGQLMLDTEMRLVLAISLVSFTLLYYILLGLWVRIHVLKSKLHEE
ncbi:MAG TPA: cytochrome c biogenesis protein CcsA [Spirochaetota bacterium]|nr:cytochrome c biogenesis protein CcsA [Spirochaetota bacterium]